MVYKGLTFLCLVLLCGSLWAKPPQPGAVPPDYLGRTLAGQEVHLSTLHGNVVVISFWATWCRYCMKELPVLASMQREADRHHLPLQVVAINYEEDRRTLRQASHWLTSNVQGLMLTWDSNGYVNESFGLNGALPTMIMLRRDGTVANVHVGYDESMLDSLVAEINALLLEPAPSRAVSALRPSAPTTASADLP